MSFFYLGLDVGIKNVFNSAIGKHYTIDNYHYQDKKAQMAQLPENGEFVGHFIGYIIGYRDTSSDTFFSDQRNCSNTKMKQIMFVLRFMVFYSSDV